MNPNNQIPGQEGARDEDSGLTAEEVGTSAAAGEGGYIPATAEDLAGASLPQHDTDLPRPPNEATD